MHGVDPWTAGIERTRQKMAVYGVQNIHLHDGVAEHLPFADATFDLVVSNNGINNVADIPAVLAETYRVMKPGAQFAMTMNLDGSMHEFYTVYADLLSEYGLDESLQRLRQHIYERRRPLPEMLGLLGDAGFDVRTVDEHSFRLRYASGTAMFRHFSIRLAFLNSWKILVPADRVHELFTVLEQRLNDMAHRNAGLTLTIPFVAIDCVK